jgi:hypothetical protein
MAKTIGIILGILIVVGGIWYFTQNQNNSSEVESNTSSTQTAEEENFSEMGSIKALMERGSDVKCTYETTEEGQASSGTVYASDGKVRGDFSITTDGVAGTGHMIADSSTGYFWMEGQTSGMKMMMNEPDQTANTSNQGIDPNKEYNFACESWTPDESMFVPPSNVTFQEFTIPSVPANNDAPLDAAAVCASLPEPAKTQCLANMPKL